MATEGEMAISTTAFIGWHSPAAVLFPAHLLGDNPLLTKAVTLVCCGIITRTHRVYWFLLSEKIGNCKQRQDQNMANSMIVLLVNVLQFGEVLKRSSYNQFPAKHHPGQPALVHKIFHGTSDNQFCDKSYQCRHEDRPLLLTSPCTTFLF